MVTFLSCNQSLKSRYFFIFSSSGWVSVGRDSSHPPVAGADFPWMPAPTYGTRGSGPKKRCPLQLFRREITDDAAHVNLHFRTRCQIMTCFKYLRWIIKQFLFLFYHSPRTKIAFVNHNHNNLNIKIDSTCGLFICTIFCWYSVVAFLKYICQDLLMW